MAQDAGPWRGPEDVEFATLEWVHLWSISNGPSFGTGREGEMTVNGILFNEPMPGTPHLTNLELAEVTTYIYNAWSHKKGMITVSEVETVLENSCE